MRLSSEHERIIKFKNLATSDITKTYYAILE
jgi:hypothetical protein